MKNFGGEYDFETVYFVYLYESRFYSFTKSVTGVLYVLNWAFCVLCIIRINISIMYNTVLCITPILGVLEYAVLEY